MTLRTALLEAASYPRPEAFQHFCKRIPAAWVDAALEATGTATVRRRRLPMEQVVWLVLGIGLFRDRAIEDVVDRLGLALPSSRGAIAKSAVPPARERLGEEPMRWLFNRCSEKWALSSAKTHAWRGLSLFGIDGSSLRTPDSDANRAAFEGWNAQKSDSATPLVRVVVLMALRSHLLLKASFGPYAKTSELHHAQQLISAIPSASLTILDALYLSAALLLEIEGGGPDRHWMTVAKSNTKSRILETFGPDDHLVELTVSDEARKVDPSLPRTWRARAVAYQRPGFPRRVLLTSLRDPERFPADEIREMYHERWELELAYDEIKTELSEHEPTLRSKTPSGVRQEIWGILLGFNLVRLEMDRIAARAAVAPTRISFVAALHLMRDEWEWSAITRSPGSIPKHLVQLEDRIKRFVLPPRRSERSYPRVARDFRGYPRKKARPASQKTTDGPPDTK
jgi:hypothetical protein